MSEARRLATGSLAQQAAQVTGLLTMFAIVTVLARRLTLEELGVYGLMNALAGYLLIVQNAAAGAAVRGMAAARDESEGDAAFSTAALLYVAAGAFAAVVLAVLGLVLAAMLDVSDDLARDLRLGAAAAGVVTLVGWPLTIYRDALRARSRFVLAAGAELTGLIAFAVLVLGLAFADAPLWLIIGASAAIPLLAGATCMVVALRARLPWRLRREAVSRSAARDFLGLAGYISATEASGAAVYVIARTILGVARSAGAVGLIEGPIRAHNLIRALNGAVTVTVLPTAVRLRADGDERRLGELLVRGSRYALAGIVPLAVVGMTLAGPILDVWLGDRFDTGATAMTVLLSHWLLNGIAGVAAAMLVAAGDARSLARWAGMVAGTTVILALALVDPLGVDGVAIAMAAPYVLFFPYLLRIVLRAVPVSLGEYVRRALAPAWLLGAALAASMLLAANVLDPDTPLAVAALAAAGLAAYWAAYALLVLDADERALVGQLARRSG
jgi:O-antigen/teichoic acid export membrane protein